MSGGRRFIVRFEEHTREVELLDGTARVGDRTFTIAEADPHEIVIGDGQRQHRVFVAQDGSTRWIFFDGRIWEVEVDTSGRARRRASAAAGLSAPMPATVVRIAAPPGSAVKRGDTVLVVEAMKMEMPLRAPHDGIVKAVNCREGELVQPGAMLAEIE